MKLLTFVLLLVASVGTFSNAAEPQSKLADEELARRKILIDAEFDLADKAKQLHRQGKTQEAMPLAKRALAISRQVHGKKSSWNVTRLVDLGDMLQAIGDYPAARRCHEEALAITKEVYGEKNITAAYSARKLGSLLSAMGDYAAARPYYEQALAIRKEVRGERHFYTADSLSDLGVLLRKMRDYTAARPYLEQALAIRKEVLGEKHTDTATSLNNMGSLLSDLGDHAAARKYYEQALAIEREVLGEKHPNTARSLTNLGISLYSTRDYAAARPYFEQALAIHKEVFGEIHPTTTLSRDYLNGLSKAMGDDTEAPSADSLAGAAQPSSDPTVEQRARIDEATKLNEIALKLYSQGKAREATTLAKQALAIRKEVLGEKHRDTASSLNNLGFLLQATGDYVAARPYMEQALAIYKEVLGEEHGETAKSLNNLGILLQEMGDFPAARLYLEQALTIRKQVLGEEHRETAASLNNLSMLLLETGDYAAARPYMEQALRIWKQVLGDKHPHLATSLNNMGGVLFSIGDYAAARPHMEQALAIRREILGEKHPATAGSLHNLGLLLDAMGDHAGARPYYEQALAIYKEVLGEKHPNTATSLNSLGGLLAAMGDYAAARPYYEQSLAIRKEVLGERHPDTAGALNNLGGLLGWMEDYAAARRHYEQALAICREVFGERHPHTAMSYDNLAGLEATSGQWEAAAAHQDQARRIVRRHVASVLPSLSPKEQVTFLTARDRRALCGALSLGLVRAADPSLVSLSAGWLLNGKAVAQEAAAQVSLLSRRSDDPKIGAEVKQLLGLRRQLAALTLSAPQPGQEAIRNAQLEKLERQEETLARHIAEANGEAFQADPWIEVAAVRRALAANAALVDIARFDVYRFDAKGQKEKWQPARYVAWVISPAGGQKAVKIIDLGEAEKIDRAVQQVRQGVRAAMGEKGTVSQQGEPEAEKTLQGLLEQLARLVLEPILKEVGDAEQLIVSPDAALWLVPWGALPLSDGRYAIEQYQIHYVVSGRDLVTRPAYGLKATKPMIMADPNFDLSPTETQAATRAVFRGVDLPGSDGLRSVGPLTSSSSLPKVARLPFTAVEAQLIAPKLESYANQAPVQYTDLYALESVFKALKRPQVVVVSTHGFFLEDQEAKPSDRTLASPETRGAALTVDGKPIENPLLRCGLLLAGCNQSGEARAADAEDGVLTAMEIVGTDLRGTELAVLSACETGLGQIQNGEGVAGLRQAFQLAGAQAVVATLWKIPDRESARLMTAFFENLAAGQTKADALHNAQLKMIEYRRDKYAAAHPFFWAAFTITGE